MATPAGSPAKIMGGAAGGYAWKTVTVESYQRASITACAKACRENSEKSTGQRMRLISITLDEESKNNARHFAWAVLDFRDFRRSMQKNSRRLGNFGPVSGPEFKAVVSDALLLGQVYCNRTPERGERRSI